MDDVLFLGIELVNAKMEPLAAQTDYLANRMKEHGILMSTDGPDPKPTLPP